jgi:hypothetical protein
MFFAAVYPGVRDLGKFGSYVHYSPPSRPYRLFSFFLEGVYNTVALDKNVVDIDSIIMIRYTIRMKNSGERRKPG